MSLRKIASSALLSFAFITSAVMADPAINQAAPNFTGKTADGKTVDLASLKGKTVVLEWTNHQCPFVIKHYDRSSNIPKLQKEATADGVVWLQVISSAPDAEGFVDGPTALKANQFREAAPTSVVLDPTGAIGHLYGAKTTPHLFIINPKGELVYKGGIDSIKSTKAEDIPQATNYVREALTALKQGKPVPNPVTAPYGCSVKYAS
ncbi:MAG TPA: thioredoxin family protein [Cellvibrionaceae bacterium]